MKLRRKRKEYHEVWPYVATAAAAGAAVGARRLLESGWQAWRGEAPPENPARWDVGWRDAVVWSAATGMVVGVSRMVAQRMAAGGWRRLTGRQPPL